MPANAGTASFLVTGEETHRIEFDNGEWIDIARCVSAVQRARWSKEATVYKTKIIGVGKEAQSQTDMEFDQEKFLMAFLRDVVKGSSRGELESAQIPEATVTRIQDEFDRLNPALGAEEATNGLGE
jgi:hypothetical protein